MQSTLLQRKRLAYKPPLPEGLEDLHQVQLQARKGPCKKPLEALKKIFPKTFDAQSFLLKKGTPRASKPLKLGAVFSGGPAAGGHNVIAGMFQALQQIDSKSQLFGFLNGPSGVIENQRKEIFEKEVSSFMNQGGFDWIGTGRTKIETEEQLKASLHTCQTLGLDGLVIIGGDDSNTNAAILAEYFLQKGCATQVIGVPKTIDGDLRSEEIEISFGFDSACKTYAELIGNIARDAISAKKYYHFVKLMGRSASHIALECALATHPNLAFIGEERKSLDLIVNETSDLICERFRAGKEYGVLLIPEGLIEFVPEIHGLIAQLNDRLAKESLDIQAVAGCLNEAEKTLFAKLPQRIQEQLLLDRDPHGNIKVSQIDTQVLLIELVQQELKKRAFKGKFAAQEHFLGYEGRACFPSNFDAKYCFALGHLAVLAVRDGLTGVLCAIQHLKSPPNQWVLQAIPIIQLMHLESRKGKEKPVIRKALVDLTSTAFLDFSSSRAAWRIEDDYQYPGPMQFFGDSLLVDVGPIT